MNLLRAKASFLPMTLMAIVLFAVSAEAGRTPDWNWELSAPNYFLEVSRPIGMIPEIALPIPGMSIETKYAWFAKAGFNLFRQMREQQDSLVWCVAKLKPHDPSQRYDGLLDGLALELDDGRRISPHLILASSITKERFAAKTGELSPVYTLYARGQLRVPVTYDQFRSETNDGDSWRVYLGFPRSFQSDDIRDILIQAEAASQAYSSDEPTSMTKQEKGGS